MTSKHTPQEWQRDGATVYALNIEGTNRFVAQVQGGWATQGRNRTEAEEVDANARLIANAPELYEAVAAVIDATRDYLPPDGITKEEFITRVIAATDNARMAEIMK